MRSVDWEGGFAESAATGSFAELIEWWIDALRSGGWVYDAKFGCLMSVHEQLDPSRRATGLL